MKDPFSKRKLLGLAIGAAVGGKQAIPAALNAALSSQLMGSDPGGYESRRSNPPRGPNLYREPSLMDLVSATEKLLLESKEDEIAAAHSRLSSFIWHSQFLHSHSLSFRKAREEQLQAAYDEARRSFSSYVDEFYRKYINDGKDNPYSQAQVAGGTGSDFRFTRGR